MVLNYVLVSVLPCLSRVLVGWFSHALRTRLNELLRSDFQGFRKPLAGFSRSRPVVTFLAKQRGLSCERGLAVLA